MVIDDEDRENVGGLIMATELATPKAIAFIVKHGTGIVCVSMKEEDLEREPSIDDVKYGTTTWVSASDKETTVLTLASKDLKPEDFNRPGPIFTLKYRECVVLKRTIHIEASIDLAMLAGLELVALWMMMELYNRSFVLVCMGFPSW
ncbi:hypothetical protein ACFE04_017519 [Oxalis oulophora]